MDGEAEEAHRHAEVGADADRGRKRGGKWQAYDKRTGAVKAEGTTKKNVAAFARIRDESDKKKRERKKRRAAT